MKKFICLIGSGVLFLQLAIGSPIANIFESNLSAAHSEEIGEGLESSLASPDNPFSIISVSTEQITNHESFTVTVIGEGLELDDISISITGHTLNNKVSIDAKQDPKIELKSISPNEFRIISTKGLNFVGTLTVAVSGQETFTQTVQAHHQLGDGVVINDVSKLSAEKNAAVNWLASIGATRGCADGQFCPDAIVTRGAMAELLQRLASVSLEGKAKSSYFDDVNSLSPERIAAIDWLYEVKVTYGTAPGKFSPDLPVNNGSMAEFFQRFAEIQNVPKAASAHFADLDGVSAARIGAIDWLAEAGLASADGSQFSPAEPVSRGAMALNLHRLSFHVVNTTHILPA